MCQQVLQGVRVELNEAVATIAKITDGKADDEQITEGKPDSEEEPSSQ